MFLARFQGFVAKHFQIDTCKNVLQRFVFKELILTAKLVNLNISRDFQIFYLKNSLTACSIMSYIEHYA